MSQLSQRVLILLVMLYAFPLGKLHAQAVTSMENTQRLGLQHACEGTGPIKNHLQYVTWVSFVQVISEGSLSSDIFEACPESPYSFLQDLFAVKITPSNETAARLQLLSLIDPDVNAPDAEQLRIRQGYGAAEYVLAIYLICQGNAECFEEVLEEDGYAERICPSASGIESDLTSPDNFELSLFQHGGDMRYFLPYLLTNCRLLAVSATQPGNTPIFDTVDQIINR